MVSDMAFASDVGSAGEELASPVERLAQEIRRRRGEASLSQAELAARIGYSRQYVSLAERPGKGLPSKELVGAMDSALAADGALLRLREEAVAERLSLRRAHSSDMSRDTPEPHLRSVLVPALVDGRVVLLPVGLPADDVSAYHVPPGGLSGEKWFASVVEWNDMSNLDRRSFLQHGLAAAALPALGLDELGRVAVALEQARRYMDRSVIDYFRREFTACAADEGQLGPTTTLPIVRGLLGAIEQTARDVQPGLRRDLLRVAATGAELAGWLCRDSRDHVRATYWRDRATEWAQEAGDTAMQGYILLKKAQAAYDERDALRMLTLAEAAQNGPWKLPLKVRAEVAQQEARGHAMLGSAEALVARKLEQAHELLAKAEDAEGDGEVGSHYNTTLLAMQTAICHTEAGQPRRAAEFYDRWLTTQEFSPRDYGYFMSLKASALALSGEPDEAVTTAFTSLPLARATSSARTIKELAKVVTALQPWQNRAAVRGLREALLS